MTTQEVGDGRGLPRDEIGRNLRAAGLGRHPFHAADLIRRSGFLLTDAKIRDLTRADPAEATTVWRLAVVYPVIDQLFVPALPFDVTYERALGSPWSPVADVRIDGVPAASVPFTGIEDYWCSIPLWAVIEDLMSVHRASPDGDPDARLLAALAGLRTAEVETATTADLPALRVMAALTQPDRWQLHRDTA